MSNWKLVRLNFGRNPTHFGEVGIGLERTSERVRSDTLFSAWVSAYARLFDIEKLLEKFKEQPENPPFRLSSTFVYRRSGNNFVDYLPKLITPPIGYPDDDLDFAKAYRKLHYLPLEIWQRWYQNEGFQVPQDSNELMAYSKKENDGSGSLEKAGVFDYKQAFKSYELPKVSIDRTTRATNFYSTGLVQFAWEPVSEPTSNLESISQTLPDFGGSVNTLAGLYFLLYVSNDDQTLESELQSALNLLGEEGMGGERSSGAGRFQVMTWQDFQNMPFAWQQVLTFDQGNRHSLMSLFWPEELSSSENKPNHISLDDWDSRAVYSIQERGGWIASPYGRQLRRHKVHMFMEGSVFSEVPKGNLADVTPDEFGHSKNGRRVPHSIYRSGVALSLPVKLQEVC